MTLRCYFNWFQRLVILIGFKGPLVLLIFLPKDSKSFCLKERKDLVFTIVHNISLVFFHSE